MSFPLFILTGVVLLLLLFVYIAARVRMSKGKLVLTAGRADVTFLMITPLFAVIGTLVYYMLPLSTLAWILWIIAFACAALSVMYSIIENKDSGWDMALSIGAKGFIITTTLFIIVLSLVYYLGYLIFFLVKEHNKSDEEAKDADKVTLPNYRKFMNAYVGLKEPKKEKKDEKKDEKKGKKKDEPKEIEEKK